MHCDCGFRFSSAWPVFFVEFFNMLIHQTIGCCIWKRIESKNFSWSEPNNVLLGKNPVKRKKSKEKPSFLADWVWFLRNFQKKKDFGFCWQDQILIECFQPFVWISHPSNGSSLLLVGLIFICWNTQIQWIVLRFHSIKAEDKEMKKKNADAVVYETQFSRHSIVTTRPPCLFVFSPHIQWISPRFQSNPVHHIRSPGCQKRNKETKRKLWKESEEVGTVGRTDFFPPFCPFWGQNGNVSWSPLPAANHGERSRFWFLLCTFN